MEIYKNEDIKIIKLNAATMEMGHLYRMVCIERECELASYPVETLMEHVEQYDTYACLLHDLLVGFITLNPDSRLLDGSLHIKNLNIDKSHKRKGIATQLILRTCRCYAGTHADRNVTVGLELPNEAALALFKSLGFEEHNDPVAMGLCTSFKIDQFGDLQPVCYEDVIGLVAPLSVLLNRIDEQEIR